MCQSVRNGEGMALAIVSGESFEAGEGLAAQFRFIHG
jgi:hypothetical protein